MMPVVYDPTIGETITLYGPEYRRPRGVDLSMDEPGASRVLARSGRADWTRTAASHPLNHTRGYRLA
jgi:hypothetical protein